MDTYKKFAIGVSITFILQVTFLIVWALVKCHRRRTQRQSNIQSQNGQDGLSPGSLAFMNVSTPPPPYQLCHTFTYPPVKATVNMDHLPTYNEAISFDNDYKIMTKS